MAQVVVAPVTFRTKHIFSWHKDIFAPLWGVIIAISVFGLLNIQALYARTMVWTLPDPSVGTSLNAVTPSVIAPSNEPRIIIPSIGVDAPVVYDEQRTDDAVVQKALERGVVHFGRSALPGTVGNAVLVGHSSNLPWVPGDYKFVFALLEHVEPGQDITLDYDGTRYTYRITEKRVVSPNNISVLEDTTDARLTLITCTPVGTDKQRLVVSATLISPPLSKDQTYQGHTIFSEPSNSLPGSSSEGSAALTKQAFAWIKDGVVNERSRDLVSPAFCVAPSTIRTAMATEYNDLKIRFHENTQNDPAQNVDERESSDSIPALRADCNE